MKKRSRAVKTLISTEVSDDPQSSLAAQESTPPKPRLSHGVTDVKPLDRKPSSQPINIDVVGDVFIETFIWSQGALPGQKYELPYTWPDELRTSKATSRFRELSGSPLHADIYRSMLESSNINSDDYRINSYPKQSSCDNFTNILDGGPFPVYLHELAPFPLGPTASSSDPKVWRIAKSFGELRTGALPNSLAAVKLKEIEDARSTQVEKDCLELAAEVKDWLTNRLPSQATSIIVVNDRNALKEQDERTSIRTVFKGIYDTFPVHTYREQLKSANNLPLVIWQTRYPLFEGDHVEQFLDDMGLTRNTIPIINYNCLREAGVPLRFDISFETTMRTFLRAFSGDKPNTTVVNLLRYPHVLIRFDRGIMHLSTDDDRNITGLDIHALNSPVPFSESDYGMMVGTTPLLVGSLLSEVAKQQNADSSNGFDSLLNSNVKHPTVLNSTALDIAIDKALLLSSMHYSSGYGNFEPQETPVNFTGVVSRESTNKQVVSTAPSYGVLVERFRKFYQRDNQISLQLDKLEFEKHFSDINLTRLSLPIDNLKIDCVGANAREAFSRVDILADRQSLIKLGVIDTSPALDTFRLVMRKVVEHGLQATVTRRTSGGSFQIEPSIFCPYVQIGRLTSVDSADIDSLLSLRNLVAKYVDDSDWDRPLAISVFGKPGTGKGYFVREALHGIKQCYFNKKLEFNLSQWESEMASTRAFHLIQDSTLEDGIPVAFFDEFDCENRGNELAWLKHFLMPIQDGRYSDGGDTFHVGKSVLVFVGGRSFRYHDFNSKFGSREDLKVPDFLSRLRAYFDVQGIGFTDSTATDPFDKPENRLTVLRRAIILRSLLKSNAPQIFDLGSDVARIDPAIIDAFLGVPDFRHGVRSMEAIIQMSRIGRKATSFQTSALPNKDQLDLHVEVTTFLRFLGI